MITPVYDTTMGYVNYIDKLREKFTIRIEVRNTELPACDTETHFEFRDALISHLSLSIPVSKWEIQDFTGYKGLHYIWFMEPEDALAFKLRFNGKVV